MNTSNQARTSGPDQSEIVIHANGGTTFVGKDATSLFRAIMLASSMRLWQKTGLRPTPGVGPMVMLKIASEYTGKQYTRAKFDEAITDLRKWIETMKAAMPIADARPRVIRQFELDGRIVTEDQLIVDNPQDTGLRMWMRIAEIGDVFGGGAGAAIARVQDQTKEG